ncbi:MAG: phosphoglycerate kinase [Deltaproteobacteria bacterium]|jgi:phosphoglycerate kinase|nr:phosphoglycerate kinase [Deltaproteobacteria bacterium]
MKFGIRTLDEISVNNKTVILRVDINQPVDQKTGQLKDIMRIKASLPTIKELADKGAKLVVLAHQGSDIEYKNFYSLKPHAEVLSELLGREVIFIEDVCGPAALAKIKELKAGEILLLDNVRFLSEEQTLFELNLKLSAQEQAKTLLIRKLAPLADYYVGDAFAASHRDQPSLCAFQEILPSAMGRLFEIEYCVISELMESPKRPCLFVLGGAKINDAFMMMEAVLNSGVAYQVLVGGLVAEILDWAIGTDLGQATIDFLTGAGHSHLRPVAKKIMDLFPDRIIRPIDYAYVRDGVRFEAKIGSGPSDNLIVDIGAESAGIFQEHILKAQTVFVNGPMGIFEEPLSSLGTRLVWEALGETKAYTVIGGGDSITAAAKFNQTEKIDYICTGGGALIRFLTGEELPAVKALRRGSQI